MQKYYCKLQRLEGLLRGLPLLQDSETKTLTLTREEIQLPAVTGKRIGGKTGYIKIHMFSSSTFDELKQLSQSMGEVSHWIIDLRNNPGGYLTSAQQVLGLINENSASASEIVAGSLKDYKAATL